MTNSADSWLVEQFQQIYTNRKDSRRCHIVKADGTIEEIDLSAILVSNDNEGIILAPSPKASSIHIRACRHGEGPKSYAPLVIQPGAANIVTVLIPNLSASRPRPNPSDLEPHPDL